MLRPALTAGEWAVHTVQNRETFFVVIHDGSADIPKEFLKFFIWNLACY
jgi:hypothetical protein